MKKIVDYKLVSSAGTDDVEKFVRSFLNDGWELGERTVFQLQSPGRPTFFGLKGDRETRIGIIPDAKTIEIVK